MSWFSAETSGRRAIELFSFTRGADVWRYAHSPRDVTVGGLTYRGAAITRTAPVQDDEAQAAAVRVTLTARSALGVVLLAAGPYLRPLYGTVGRVHAGETEVVQFWSGEVGEVVFEEDSVTLSIASIRTMLQRPLGRMKLQPRCNNSLFDHHCGLDQRDYAWPGSLTAIDADIRTRQVTVTVDAHYDSGYFSGGRMVLGDITHYVELAEAGGEVEAPYTQTLALLHPPAPGTVLPADVTLYPGCDGSINTCRIRFANRQNFTGFPAMPQRNPLGKNNT